MTLRFVLALGPAIALAATAAASCRKSDKPVPAVPVLSPGDAGPEQGLDGGSQPIGPLAGEPVRDAAADAF